jgi:hypothetical protein
MGVLISVALPQHVFSFLFEVISLEICSKNGIHLVASWDSLLLELTSAGEQTSQGVRT